MKRKTPSIPVLPVFIPPTPAPGGIDEKAALAVAQIAATLIASSPKLGDVEALERACELIAKARQLPATLENIQAALDSIQTMAEMNEVIGAMPGNEFDRWWKDPGLDADVIRKLGKKPDSLWNPDERIPFDLFLNSGIVPRKERLKKLLTRPATFQMFLEWRAYAKECLGDDLAQDLFDKIDDFVRERSLKKAAMEQADEAPEQADEGQSLVPNDYKEFVAFAKVHGKTLSGTRIGRGQSESTAADQIGDYQDHGISAREIWEFAVLMRPWHLADGKWKQRGDGANLKEANQKRES